MVSYYNEIDPYAAQWLRNLIANKLIADGDVDERSIRDVAAADLHGYTQCHFFAGIGVWSYALRLAGWPDDRPVWTGSCPCQPFSAAGKRQGEEDERHLWPEFHRLIRECRPPVVFGEQVASKDGLGWLDTVCADMEGAGYAIGAADLCAAGVGAPHIRQRLWFVGERLADTESAGSQGRAGMPERANQRAAWAGGMEGGLEHAARDGRGEWRAGTDGRGVAAGCGAGGLADAADCGREPFTGHRGVCVSDDGKGSAAEQSGAPRSSGGRADAQRPGARNSPWQDADWLHCRDGKWRPVEPGTFPLAHGAPARVGRLRAYGNAIVPQVAAEVISAFMEYADA